MNAGCDIELWPELFASGIGCATGQDVPMI